jgi:hypothetical protein
LRASRSPTPITSPSTLIPSLPARDVSSDWPSSAVCRVN